MADQTSNGPHLARHAKGPSLEYWVYFTLIFIVSLPAGLVNWLIGLTRPEPNKGMIGRAWDQAQVITPRIFSL